MSGMSSRAASGHQASHAFLLHLAPLGGRVLDDNWNPIVNNAAGVRMTNALKTIVDCGPEGASGFAFGEALASFLQGRTAMCLDTTVVAVRSTTEQIKGRRQGRMGAASDGCATRLPDRRFRHWHPEERAEQEAAFLLMQWLTSKKGDKLVAMAGETRLVPPTRMRM